MTDLLIRLKDSYIVIVIDSPVLVVVIVIYNLNVEVVVLLIAHL